MLYSHLHPPTTLRYDDGNQMLVYENTNGGDFGMVRLQYDALGRRVSRTRTPVFAGEPDTVTAYVNGGQASWQVLAEYDGVANIANQLATYVYGNYIDEPIQMSRDFDGDGAGAVQHFYYHQDDLFNVIALTAGVGGSSVPGYANPFAAGAVVERVRYGDYGAPEFIDAAGTALLTESPTRNPSLFTGREWDGGIRFYHYRTRYMEPTWGRFTTRDSIGTWGDMYNVGNGVAYIGGKPQIAADPFGQEPLQPWQNPNEVGPPSPDLPSPVERLRKAIHDTITPEEFARQYSPTYNQCDQGDYLKNLRYKTPYGLLDVDWFLTLLAAKYGHFKLGFLTKRVPTGPLYWFGKRYWILKDWWDDDVPFRKHPLGQPDEELAVKLVKRLLDNEIDLEDIFPGLTPVGKDGVPNYLRNPDDPYPNSPLPAPIPLPSPYLPPLSPFPTVPQGAPVPGRTR